MTAVLGGLGTFGAFVVAMVLDPVVLATGGGWMVAGTLLYVAYRRYKGLPLTETVKVDALDAARGRGGRVPRACWSPSTTTIRSPRRPWRRRRRSRRAGGGRSTSLSLVDGADEPAARRRAATSGEARGADEDRAGEADLRPAGQRQHRPRAAWAGRARRSSRRRRQINAAAIVMPLRYRDGAPLYGKTLQTVLAKRPCRVIVSANPRRVDRRAAARCGRHGGGRGMSGPQPDEVYRARHPDVRGRHLGFGIAIVVVTLANGGGLASTGLWLGLLFIGLGAGRLVPRPARERR